MTIIMTEILSIILFTLFIIGSFGVDVQSYKNSTVDAINNKENRGKKWIVLVAGSRGWSNYRHQADICHAYQIIRGNGIPEENIITMMVDDIAYHPRNPTPGKIINQPNGTDVYKGVVIDYKRDDVTKSNFLNIITGNKKAMQSIGTGKVVEGGPYDTIFINFVDHGSTGLLSFPNEYLYADQLNDAFNAMYKTSSYKKMLLYVEACRAGSMFDGILNENTGIMAVTASGPREDSYGCYCRSQSLPYRTCLGDLFSVTWMENLDAKVYDSSAKRRTVFNAFNGIRTNVTDSNVMAYGDFNTGHEKLSAFISFGLHHDDQSTLKRIAKSLKSKITMSNRDVYRNGMQYQMANVKITDYQKLELIKESRQNNEMRLYIDRVFRDIFSRLVRTRPGIKEIIGELDQPKNLDITLDMFPCYRSILNKISRSCFSLPRNPYTTERLTIFANLCVVDNTADEMINNLVEKSCSNFQKNIVHVY